MQVRQQKLCWNIRKSQPLSGNGAPSEGTDKKQGLSDDADFCPRPPKACCIKPDNRSIEQILLPSERKPMASDHARITWSWFATLDTACLTSDSCVDWQWAGLLPRNQKASVTYTGIIHITDFESLRGSERRFCNHLRMGFPRDNSLI